MSENSNKTSDFHRLPGVLDDNGVFCRPRKAKPSSGIMSYRYWIENRVDDILEAMEQYRRGKYIIPVEWVEELAQHLKELQNINRHT